MSGPDYPFGAPPPDASNAPTSAPGLTLGQIIERVFRLLRANLRLFLSLAAAPALALLAVMILAGGLALILLIPLTRNHSGPPDPWAFAWIAIPVIGAYTAILPVFALYAAAASYAVVRTDLGYAVTSSEAWAAAWKRWGRYVGLIFLIVLFVSGPFYVLIAVGAGTMFLFGFGAAAGIPSLLLFLFSPLFALLIVGSYVFSIFALLYLSLAFPACVMEDLPVTQAIRRSVDLTRGAKGRIFLVLLVIYAATYVVNMVCVLAFFLVGGLAAALGALAHVALQSPAGWFLFAPFGLLGFVVIFLGLITLPYAGYTTAFGVLYRDQLARTRADGHAQ